MKQYKRSVTDSFHCFLPVETFLASGPLKWSNVYFWSLIPGQIVSFDGLLPAWRRWVGQVVHQKRANLLNSILTKYSQLSESYWLHLHLLNLFFPSAMLSFSCYYVIDFLSFQANIMCWPINQLPQFFWASSFYSRRPWDVDESSWKACHVEIMLSVNQLSPSQELTLGLNTSF